MCWGYRQERKPKIEEGQGVGSSTCWDQSCVARQTGVCSAFLLPDLGFALAPVQWQPCWFRGLRDPRGRSLYNPSSSKGGGEVTFKVSLLAKSKSIMLPQLWIFSCFSTLPTLPSSCNEFLIIPDHDRHGCCVQIHGLYTAQFLEATFPWTKERIMHNFTRQPWARSFYDFLPIYCFHCQECPCWPFLSPYIHLWII